MDIVPRKTKCVDWRERERKERERPFNISCRSVRPSGRPPAEREHAVKIEKIGSPFTPQTEEEEHDE